MPKITINERDLTSAGVQSVSSNAVFIPGYAITGPINEPILCESLEAFTSIFGSLPYVFKKAQTFSGIFNNNVVKNINDYSFEKDSYEQSFIYALEALNRGLPVIYSRIFNGTKANNYTATSGEISNFCTIKAKYPGASGTNIYYTITPAKKNTTDNFDGTPLTLKIGRKHLKEDGLSNGLPEVSEEIFYITTPEDTIRYSPEYALQLNTTLSSNLVDFSDWNLPSDLSTVSEAEETALTITGGDAEFEVADLYAGIEDQLEYIADRAEYPVKFLTSGAYPMFGTTKDYDTLYAKTAEKRGDCVALIDYIPNTSDILTGSGSVIDSVRSKTYSTAGAYASMFYPAGICSCPTVGQTLVMPASFDYIMAYARSVQYNPSWLAVAGASRGTDLVRVSSLGKKITTAVIDNWQNPADISINPITTIRPYGILIWGNRTLKNNSITGGLTAQSFLNIRSLLCDLKKIIYTTAKGLTFEQNSDILWINFKSGITPTLDQMVSGNGLSGYEIKRVKTTKKATLKAVIRLYAVEAVEDFEVDIELADNNVTTTE